MFSNYQDGRPLPSMQGFTADADTRLSHVANDEDVIGQVIGVQQPQQQQQQINPPQSLQQRAQADQNYQQPQQTPVTSNQTSMSLHGRSLSITFSPDGTVNITIQ